MPLICRLIIFIRDFIRAVREGGGALIKYITRGMNTISWRMELAVGGRRRSGAGRENDI